MKNIYVIENDHGLIKIGISQNVENRIKTLSSQGGFKVKQFYHTEQCSNHYYLENSIHSSLKKYRRIGEWFEISFDEAVKTVDKYFSMYAKQEKIEKDYSKMADAFFDRAAQLK